MKSQLDDSNVEQFDLFEEIEEARPKSTPLVYTDVVLTVDGDRIRAEWSHGIYSAWYQDWSVALDLVLHSKNDNIRVVRVR